MQQLERLGGRLPGVLGREYGLDHEKIRVAVLALRQGKPRPEPANYADLKAIPNSTAPAGVRNGGMCLKL